MTGWLSSFVPTENEDAIIFRLANITLCNIVRYHCSPAIIRGGRRHVRPRIVEPGRMLMVTVVVKWCGWQTLNDLLFVVTQTWRWLSARLRIMCESYFVMERNERSTVYNSGCGGVGALAFDGFYYCACRQKGNCGAGVRYLHI